MEEEELVGDIDIDVIDDYSCRIQNKRDWTMMIYISPTASAVETQSRFATETMDWVSCPFIRFDGKA